jgi:hypothetical protein
LVFGLAAVAGGAFAQPPPVYLPTYSAPRPASLFTEVWQQPPFTGALNDETRRATQAALTHPRLELKLYGTDARNVGVYDHEGRFDLWTGMVASSVAIMLKDTANSVDLTGRARLRAMVRTLSLHVIHPALKLADGTYIVGSGRIDTAGEFLQLEVAYGGMRWFRLDPARVVTGVEVVNPDLTRVDEIGFVDLAPGGGHGIAGAFNVSTLELFANPVPR